MSANVFMKTTGRFVGLVLFQVLILNYLNIGGHINPMLYIYFILILPFATPRWLLLMSSFLLGVTIDLFNNTLGLNAAACVMAAFIRSAIINLLTKENEITNEEPSLRFQGFIWFLYYSSLLVLIHHMLVFFLEIFTLKEFFTTIIRLLFSSTATIALILLCEIIFMRKERKTIFRK